MGRRQACPARDSPPSDGNYKTPVTTPLIGVWIKADLQKKPTSLDRPPPGALALGIVWQEPLSNGTVNTVFTTAPLHSPKRSRTRRLTACGLPNIRSPTTPSFAWSALGRSVLPLAISRPSTMRRSHRRSACRARTSTDYWQLAAVRHAAKRSKARETGRHFHDHHRDQAREVLRGARHHNRRNGSKHGGGLTDGLARRRKNDNTAIRVSSPSSSTPASANKETADSATDSSTRLRPPARRRVLDRAST